ncbi:sensor histidine kinase [Archangium lansingense]|uniref:histidine kinase n=1 Tax=Archangium lansingense TaxID=2995310 RepID=A0ABT4A0S3_9BACT|nr:ATP-binding protein [Archangium lansinium]MCY1074589.1 PAS domain S-box protein [Archangium lansinium]
MEKTPSSQPSSPVVLIVEDDEAKRYLLARALELAGFRTREAATGNEALMLAREAPDVLLLDVRLPDVSGFEVSRKLKQDPATASIPIIQMSASFTTTHDRTQGLLGGADGYLVAPVEPEELVATLRTVLRTHEVSREREQLLESERSARAALEAANAQLSTQVEILANVHDSVIVTDLSGIISYWNRGATQLFGYTAEEMLGRSVSTIYPSQATRERELAEQLDHIIEHGERTTEWQGKHKDGSEVWATVRTVTMRSARGEPIGFIGVSRDITEVRRLRAEALRRAELAQQLVGIVSHDLRNPLTAITLAAESGLRKEGQDAATQVRLLTRIRSSAERMTRMVRELLDFTQASVGNGITLNPHPEDLHELARQVVEEVQFAHPGRTVLLECTGDGKGTLDADRMAQMLTNLLTNALQYSPPDTAVTVSSTSEPDALLLRVHNLGRPIPPEDLERIFEPLQRGAAGTDSAQRSIGLGLFIVNHIVRAHRGDIQVRSSQEKGTTFTVRIARHAKTAEDAGSSNT